jgi:hypothetical protein
VCDRAQAIIKICHISQQTLYKAHNKALWHPKEYQPPTPIEQPEVQTGQGITQLQPKNRIGGASQPFNSLLYIVISQLLIYVGFVILLAQISAATALALKGQRADQAALENQAVREGERSEVGQCASEVSSIENWRQLKLSLPERFQQKVRQAENRQRSQTLLQLQLPVEGQGLEPREICLVEAEPVAAVQPPLKLPSQLPEVVASECQPLVDERREFSEWFDLARQGGIVTASMLIDGVMCVCTNPEVGDWQPWTELAFAFTTRYLRSICG